MFIKVKKIEKNVCLNEMYQIKSWSDKFMLTLLFAWLFKWKSDNLLEIVEIFFFYIFF